LEKTAFVTLLKLALEADLKDKNKTNHSARKTTAQTLLHANVPPTDVVQLTGHKNTQSLNSYSHMSTVQQREVSHLLFQRISPTSDKHTIQEQPSNMPCTSATIDFGDQFDLDIPGTDGSAIQTFSATAIHPIVFQPEKTR